MSPSSARPSQLLSLPSHTSGGIWSSGTHWLAHFVRPVGQLLPHGSDAPTQCPLHSRKSALHLRLQASPSQALTPLGSRGHLVHELPQVSRLLASTQAPAQGFLPGSHPPQLEVSGTHLPWQLRVWVGH